MTGERPPVHEVPKATGLRHLILAMGYSLAGLRRMMRETAFRQEVFGGGIVLGLFALAGAPAWAFLAQIMLLLALLATEALNSAVELLVDRVSPEFSVFARDAKDIGSLAVACLVTANGIFSATTLIRALFGF